MQSNNKKIKNAVTCETGNLKFKSLLEKGVYNTLFQLGFNPLYEPKTFVLWEGFEPITPFYDKESPAQYKKRIDIDNEVKSKLLTLKSEKVIGIRYTPDFYFRYNNLDVYIEAKGKENDVFYIKKKLFRYYLDKQLQTTGQHSIFFEVYNKKQLLQAIEIMKDYEATI